MVSILEFQAPGAILANLFSVPYQLKNLLFDFCHLPPPNKSNPNPREQVALGPEDWHFPGEN